MRKDVKRSLILWPTLATTFVALMLGFTIVRDISQCIGPETEKLAPATLPSFDFGTASVTNIDISSRGEHGRRAMVLPDRVADVLGVRPRPSSVGDASASKTQATDRTTRKQIAGMIMPPWGVVIETSPEIERIVVPAPAMTDLDLTADRSSMLEGIMELNPPASRMPRSNRVLAKPEFPKQDSDMTAAESVAAELIDVETYPAVSTSDVNASGLAKRKAAVENRKPVSGVTGWPATAQLNSQLNALANWTEANMAGKQDADSSSIAGATHWASQVITTLGQLQALRRLGDEEAETLIDSLDHLADQGIVEAEQVMDRNLQIDWLRAAHGVARRVAVWKPVWRVANSNSTFDLKPRFAIAMKPDRSDSVFDAIERVRLILPDSGDAAGWDQYLLLNQISAAADSNDQSLRTSIAKQFVSRIQRPGLHPLHQQWLQHESIESLWVSIQPWARGVVDYADLLSDIEHQESTAAETDPAKVAKAMQTLRFADSPMAIAVAESIDTHYRNANVRTAITEAMLQRLMPEIPAKSLPVRAQHARQSSAWHQQD